MTKRIAIVTTKQPGTNPRMRKNADALSAAGHDVHVLYAYNTLWADATDQLVFAKAAWSHHRIGGHPQEDRLKYLLGRTRRKWSNWTGDLHGIFTPCLHDYVDQLQKLQPDLVMGHNPGALPILSEWSQYGPVLFDAEDDHPGEFASGSLESRRVEKLEQEALGKLHHITAASPLIAEEYRRRFPHLQVTPIDNAFERSIQPEFQTIDGDSLKLVWFSQVIGLDRGIQKLMMALQPLAHLNLHFTLIGLVDSSVREELQAVIQSPRHTLSFEPPLPEKELLKTLGQHHIGLALETGTTRNRQLCRTNKLFCYPLAGCVTLASNTRSQTQFMEEHPEAGVVFESDEQLIQIIQEWAGRMEAVHEHRSAAWQLGRDTLNWETESKKLVKLVKSLLQDAP